MEFGQESTPWHRTSTPVVAVPEQVVHAYGIRLSWVLDADPSTGWSAWHESLPVTAAAAGAPPAEVAATPVVSDTVCSEHLIDRLQRQLDAFSEEDQFLGRFAMLGRKERLRGGVQGCDLSSFVI